MIGQVGRENTMEQEKVPVQGQVAERTISLTASWAFFALSIVINSMGNVLTLVTSSTISWFRLLDSRRKQPRDCRFRE